MSNKRPPRGTLCLTFDNMGRAREIALGLAGSPDPNEPSLAVGYPRILGLLDELRLRATFFIEGWNVLHHPHRVRELAERGHEVALHGWVHENFASLNRGQSEQMLHDGTAAMRRIGIDPRGFRAPGGIRGAHAARILTSLGYRYDSSTENDLSDAAEWTDFSSGLEIKAIAPGLIHIPWRYAMVDSVRYLRNPAGASTPRELETSWIEMIDRAAACGGVMTLVIHPYVSGVDDARFAAVRAVLGHAASHPGIEVCRAIELADRASGLAAPGDRHANTGVRRVDPPQ